MNKIKRWALWLGGGLLVLVLVVLAWALVDTAIKETSHAAFCGSCHVMEPMVASYYDSAHGGQNPVGVQAECTDCHLPHDNALVAMAAKTRLGVHDLWVTWTQDEFAIDWQAKREERNEYVFDSGCQQCHTDLRLIDKGLSEHEKYLSGLIDSQCVDCHDGVGHDNLNRYLLQTRYRYSE